VGLLSCTMTADSQARLMQGGELVRRTAKLRPWTKDDLRTLKTLAREKVRTSVIARKL
jgi:hypothetical protein